MTELKEFEKLCQRHGIHTSRESHILSNSELYKIFQDIKKNYSEKNNHVESQEKQLRAFNAKQLPEIQEGILQALTKKTLTTKQLSRGLGFAERTINHHLLKLISLELITTKDSENYELVE